MILLVDDGPAGTQLTATARANHAFTSYFGGVVQPGLSTWSPYFRPGSNEPTKTYEDANKIDGRCQGTMAELQRLVAARGQKWALHEGLAVSLGPACFEYYLMDSNRLDMKMLLQ